MNRVAILALPLTAALASCSTDSGPTTNAAETPPPQEFRLEEATIDSIQRAIVTKEVTTVEVVERYLARIKAYNGTCVKEPNGLLGAGVETIPHAGQINALSTLNLRP